MIRSTLSLVLLERPLSLNFLSHHLSSLLSAFCTLPADRIPDHSRHFRPKHFGLLTNVRHRFIRFRFRVAAVVVLLLWQGIFFQGLIPLCPLFIGHIAEP